MLMMRRFGLFLTFANAVFFVATRGVHAQLAPALGAVPPIALKQGQTIEIALSGQRLGGVGSASIANAGGVSAALVKADKPSETEVHLKLSAASDAALGDRELRLIGPSGATRPVRVFVSQWDVIAEKEPNNQLSEAQEIQLPATIIGRIDGAGDVDQFRFPGKKGQKLVFDVHAARSGSPLEAVATIHASTGRELRPIHEHRAGDPVLIFEVPEDAQYVLRLRDLRYRGGGDYHYRIEAGQIPLLDGLLPGSGQPGKLVEVRAVGYNLEWGEKFIIDLTNSAPGLMDVRARTPLGYSNPIGFEVTELPQLVESEPNDKPETANVVGIGSEISGHIDHAGDVDMFRFHVAYRQPVSLQVLAGRLGSPVTPLLQLRNVKGEVIESNDGAPDADARIARELDPGDYIVSVRDLTFAGGTGHWYRLRIERATTVAPDFAVRFLPDAPRLHRGGNLAMWCEVKRLNGFKGDVTVGLDGSPPGVTAGPVVLNEDASGWFTIAANPDAALGTVPIRLHASATIGAVTVSHDAEPEIDGRPVKEAYLTVLEPAPFKVEAVATMNAQRFEQLNGEIQSLAARLNAPDPKFDASLAEWEKKLAQRPQWTLLQPATATSSKSTPLTTQPSDGSFLVTGSAPAQDQYTVTAHTSLKGITAVRLEVLADEHLPSHGPGAAPNGNFVLSEFKMLAGKEGQEPQPVAFKRATADFSQKDYPISAAIDNHPDTGWAIDPQEGRSHTAIFETANPVGSEEGTTLTFVMDQVSVFPQHNLGRFRLLITNADPQTLALDAQVPRNVLAIVDTPPAQRTSDQKKDLAGYFRTIDPQTIADRTRLEALRGFASPYAEMERLEKALREQTPQLDAEQALWEQSLSQGAGWSVLDITEVRSSSGAQLQRESDGAVFVDGASPPTDTYTLTATTSLKGITAVRLEALADSRLPGNGPGRAGDGNFVLSGFRVLAVPRPAPSTQPATQPATAPVAATQPATQPTTAPAVQEISIESARASFEQQGFGIAGALDGKEETGWGVGGATGRPAEATFYLKRPLEGEGGSALTLLIEQLSKQPQHTLGHFRIWVTANRQPDAAWRVPEKLASILKVTSGGRSDEQKRELAVYFRSIAPSLRPVRERLVDLRAAVPGLPFKVRENGDGAIPVPIVRLPDFKADVQVTLEGFANGRDGDKPAPIGRALQVNPLSIASDKLFGALTFKADGIANTVTRMVVLKAESKVGNDTVVEYSPAFPLTVEK